MVKVTTKPKLKRVEERKEREKESKEEREEGEGEREQTKIQSTRLKTSQAAQRRKSKSDH